MGIKPLTVALGGKIDASQNKEGRIPSLFCGRMELIFTNIIWGDNSSPMDRR